MSSEELNRERDQVIITGLKAAELGFPQSSALSGEHVLRAR